MKLHDSVNEAKQGCGGGAQQKDPVKEGIENNLAKIKNILFVMSGKGGVGKSSISTNLATALAEKGFKVGLMDVDLHGPSIAQMFGIKGLLDIAPDKQSLLPTLCGKNLKVVSMQSLIQDPNQAIIWRGPAKTGMINQFVGSVQWGDLDFLIIDAPPGTGDEPLTVAQTMPEAKAVIITTPQNVALADVKKSINFCKTVKIDILGVIENMGPFKCPCCDEIIELFKSGGGASMAKKMDVNFLGSVPFDPEVVTCCDDGTPIVRKNSENNFSKNLDKIVTQIAEKLG